MHYTLCTLMVIGDVTSCPAFKKLKCWDRPSQRLAVEGLVMRLLPVINQRTDARRGHEKARFFYYFVQRYAQC